MRAAAIGLALAVALTPLGVAAQGRGGRRAASRGAPSRSAAQPVGPAGRV
jgi:hypothetical protein